MEFDFRQKEIYLFLSQATLFVQQPVCSKDNKGKAGET
jgi:hypothetical protein